MIDEDDPRVAKIGHPAPPWLINYADLMTELVCFFVILYALSAVLNKNVQKAFTEMQEVMKEEKMAGEAKMTKEGLKISPAIMSNMPIRPISNKVFFHISVKSL